MRTHLSIGYGLLFNTLPLTSPLSRLTMARSNSSEPKVDKMQQLLHSGGWDKCWEKGLTPWDLGQPTPILVHLHQTGSLPKGRALVPGCGSGHDVVALACPERFVVGLDASEIAIKQATKLFSSSKNVENFSFLEADFFTWRPTQLFDLIFDYTFFCAIEPEMRLQWASRIRDLLKPDGELITLIFPISDHEVTKKSCIRWGSGQSRLLRMTWLFHRGEEERSWEGGKSPYANPCSEYTSYIDFKESEQIIKKILMH